MGCSWLAAKVRVSGFEFRVEGLGFVVYGLQLTPTQMVSPLLWRGFR